MALLGQVLVVGGGGGGQNGYSGTCVIGGGGGQVQYNGSFSISAGANAVTVGVGGSSNGGTGGNSVFSTITSNGGVSGTSGNGNTSGTSTTYAGGGGGGSGGVGGNAPSNAQGGNGGNGTSNSITGTAVVYGGGGGGGGGITPGNGQGGGGTGGTQSANATAGTTNTGGGGGGGGAYSYTTGGIGGSGVVIIAYHYNGSDGISNTSTGGTITTYGSGSSQMQVHTFTASGTFTAVATALPTVTTQAASSISINTAIANGNITATGGILVDTRGVIYDTSSHSLPGNVTPGSSGYASNVTESGSFSTGAFTENISGLLAGTTYYVRAFSHNSLGYSYGNEILFTTTTPVLPIVTTQAASSTTLNSAVGNGTITNLGGAANCITRGFVYENSSHSLPGNVAPSSSGYALNFIEYGTFYVGAFSDLISLLTPNTTYYIRAFCQNSVGYSYGSEISFKTQTQAPILDVVLCAANVSDYKWLTPTLKTAQQQFAVRPYYECRIIDDSLAPQSTITGNLFNNLSQGSSINAPDGKILAVGLNASNNVVFLKGTMASAISTTLENNIHNRSALNHYAIQCSDYIQGTYKIDIYFFGNWDNNLGSGYLSLIHYCSLDGGNTWSSTSELNPGTVIPHNQTANIWVAAGKPYQANNGNIISTVFYITPQNNYFHIVYQQYPGTGTVFSSDVRWSFKNINTQDWILHSLDVALIKGTFYVVFSGYHLFYDAVNQNPAIQNYNLYITKIEALTGLSTTDIWTPANVIISALSSSAQNLNSFTLPQLLYDQTTALFILFNGVTVNSVDASTGTTNVATVNGFYMCQSTDFSNFSYPQPVILPAGTAFSDTNANSFINQLPNYYILGNGQIWQFIKNNIVADVSQNILDYTINETQDSPSTITMDIGNQDNQWIGTTPTLLGYQAIAGNKKLCLFQGYYNALGIPEIAPKNTFYIDDITQNITSNANDFTLSCRDLYKALNIIKTKFAYNYLGIKKYVDIFDGTTLGNYNVVRGTWIEELLGPGANALVQTDVTQTDSLILFSYYQQSKANSVFSVSMLCPFSFTAGFISYIYFYYVDANNWLRLKISSSGNIAYCTTAIQQNVAGVITTGTTSEVINNGVTNTFMFTFIRYNYSYFTVYLGDSNGYGLLINSLINATNGGPQCLGSINFSGFFNGLGSIGFGDSLNLDTSIFRNFRYQEFDTSENIEELIKSIATKAGIYNYKMPTLFKDNFYNSNGYSGAFNLVNRILNISSGSIVYKNYTLTDGEIKFSAQMTPINSSADYYFDFVFRNKNGIIDANNNYFIRFANEVGSASSNFTSAKLYQTYNGTQYLLGGSGGIAYGYGSYTNEQNLEFDLTQMHEYRVIVIGQYMFFTIDSQIVFGWNDNNVTNIQTTGILAFRTSNNSTLQISYIQATALYSQLESYSINPGDDLQSSIENLLTTIRVYFFSDNFGRFKVNLLSSSDPANYTYNNQLTVQQTDYSDKEFYNQITVNGQGVTATVRNAASISESGMIREEVITDYTITTYSDALLRANSELTNANKYNTQFNPQCILNVGSEMYDVITVINTGNNSSDVDEEVRIYSQSMSAGGSQNNYWLDTGTGSL